jgi:hypothetical protein
VEERAENIVGWRDSIAGFWEGTEYKEWWKRQSTSGFEN